MDVDKKIEIEATSPQTIKHNGNVGPKVFICWLNSLEKDNWSK